MPDAPTVDFVYELAGDVREIDVFELAPALLALGNTIRSANDELFPDTGPVNVAVRPASEGSYITEVVVSVPAAATSLLAVAAMSPGGLDRLVMILKSLGFIYSASKASVLKVMDILGGKPKTIEEVGGKLRYHSANNTVSVSGSVHQLLQNPRITQNIYNVFEAPLRDERVTGVRTYSRDKAGKGTLVTKKSLAAMKEFAEERMLAREPEETVSERVSFLHPKRGSFEADGSRWSFRKGDDILSNVSVKDHRFLEAYARGEYRLNHTDILKVRLVERQRVTPGGAIDTSHEVCEVLEYRQGPEQQRLPAETRKGQKHRPRRDS